MTENKQGHTQHALVEEFETRLPHLVDTIEALSNIESTSNDIDGLMLCAEALAKYVVAETGVEPKWHFAGEERRPHLQFDFGERTDVLVIGHFDIHYEPGVLNTFPVERKGDQLFGPGVLDMKQGVVLMVEAMRHILRTNPHPNVTLFFNSDEEIGSVTSKHITRELAPGTHVALAFEFSMNEYLPKIASRGIRQLRFTISGRGGHSGYAHEHVNPLFAVGDLLHMAEEMSDFEAGLLATPTMISDVNGRGATVPDAVVMYIDVRGNSEELLDSAEQRLRSVQFRHPEVECHVDRPIMVPTLVMRPDNRVGLLIRAAAEELGLPDPGFHEAKGISDVNYLADIQPHAGEGLGGWGEGAHRPVGEYLTISSLLHAGPMATTVIQRALESAEAERAQGRG